MFVVVQNAFTWMDILQIKTTTKYDKKKFRWPKHFRQKMQIQILEHK
jgi:hypothetical protein